MKQTRQHSQLDTLFSTAERSLLAPYSINSGKIEQIFASMMANRLDYADLYFQYSRAESWSLEEGIVKSGSFNIDQGVGVRAVAGDRTAFAYSDDLSPESLNEAALTARAIARQGSGRARVAPRVTPRPQAALYGTGDPVASLDAGEKIRLLERVEQLARARDPRVRQVMANIGAEYDVVLVARSDGLLAADGLVESTLVEALVEQAARVAKYRGLEHQHARQLGRRRLH